MKRRSPSAGSARVVNPDGHVIGLDIGATAVHAAVLTPPAADGSAPARLSRVGSAALPPGAVVNGVVQELGAVTSAVRQLWAAHRVECKRVVLGIANQHVTVRDLSMPALEASRRAKALPYRAREILAMPLDQVILDFCPLTVPDPETNLVNGLLVAAPSEPVLTAVTAVERAGLKVARVDLAPFGALRAIGDSRHAVEAVLDLGAHLTTIVIHDRGVPRLVRTLARGGAELTLQLADRIGISIPEAEQLKCREGLETSDHECLRALIDTMRPLLAEIRTSIEYYRNANNKVSIDQISLSGGGAQLRGLTSAIADQIGVRTALVDPLKHLRDSSTALQSSPEEPPSAVSIGLALGAAA